MSHAAKMNPSVTGYIRKNHAWKDVLDALRAILLDSPLTEDVKWRVPCYTYEDHNVVIVGAFKKYCMFTFVKGALMKDPKGLLVKPGENTQSARAIRFAKADEVAKVAETLAGYIREAVELEKSGQSVTFKKITEHQIPDELQKAFDASAVLEKAFRALTPGRQRAYLLHFSSAKQSATRDARIKKLAPKILKGKGMND